MSDLEKLNLSKALESVSVLINACGGRRGTHVGWRRHYQGWTPEVQVLLDGGLLTQMGYGDKFVATSEGIRTVSWLLNKPIDPEAFELGWVE